MTFETKSLVQIVVLGPLPSQNTQALSQKSQLFSLSKNQSVFVFGVTKRQENDAEEALSLALKLRDPSLKIFVTTEKVLFETDTPKISWANHWQHTFDLILENEIAVSLDLVRIYQRVFDIHAKRLKHESVFILKDKKTKPDRIRGLQKKYSPLVGRKKELHTLLEVVEQSFEDQGQMASIIGDAGLGKTRLTAEFKSELVKRNIKYFEGIFSLNSDLNFRGFHQLVQQMLENNTETFSKWNLNTSEAAFLRYFLRPEEKNDTLKDLNETELTQGIFHSIQKLFSMMGQQPTVLILDDFHWAGEKSIELMDKLATMIEKTKIAFILIHRPSFTPSFQKSLNYHQIKLTPLQHDETKELVKNALKLNYVTDSAIQTLNNLSLGNPLFVEEVLRELINQKKLDIQKDEDVVRLIQVQFPQGVIPTNIHSLITARLDLLSKEAKEILQWVCTFGFRENHDDFELLLQTLHLSLDAFHSLFEQGYLEEASMFPEHKYKFTHDLLYETVKQSIPAETWKKKNQRIAEFLHLAYKNEMIVQGDRIADFFIKGEIGPESFEPIFEAAKIAQTQRRYSTSLKYYESSKLILLQSSTLKNDVFFSSYLESVFAVGEKEKTRVALQEWEKYGFSSDEDEIKFYKSQLEYSFLYRETQVLLTIPNLIFKKFTNKLTPIDTFFIQVKLLHGLVYNFDFTKAVNLAFKLLRKTNETSIYDNQKIDILYILGFITQQIGHPNIASYLTLISKNISERINADIRLKSKVYQRIAYLAVAQGLYNEAMTVWKALDYMYKENAYPADQFRIDTNCVLVNFFLGKYKESTEGFNKLKLDQYDWNFRWALNWAAQGNLAIGNFTETKEIISKFRYFQIRDPYIRCNFLYVVANFHYQKASYRKAASFYRYAKVFYLKKDQKIYGYQMQLFELRCRLLLKETTPEEATKEFDFIVSHSEMRKYFYEWNTQMLSFWFARHGCNTRFKPSEDFDPMKCNAVYLRMMMFVEKIKWLRHIGKNDEADTLKDQYLKHRQEMAFYVPDEFKKSYLDHPFYQV
jgi:hypothetical protein